MSAINGIVKEKSKNHRAIEIMAYLFMFFTGAAIVNTSVVMGDIANFLQVDVSTAVASFSYFTIAVAIMVFATTGVLLNYLSLKMVSLLTCIIISLSFGLILYVDSIQMFNIALIVYGLGYGMAFSLGYYYIILITDNKSRAAKMTLVSISYSVGALLSPKICQFLLSSGISWNFTLACFSLIAPIAFVLALFSSFDIKNEENIDTKKPKLQIEKNWLEEIKSWPISVYLMMFALFAFCISDTVISLWLAVYGHMEMGFTKDQAAYLPSLFWGSIIFGRIIAAWALKKMSQENFCIIIGFASGTIFVALAFIPMSFYMALTVVTIAGLCYAAGYTTIAAIGTIQVPKASNKLSSIILVSGSLGFALSPFISSKLGITYVLAATGLLLFVAPIMVIISTVINKTRKYVTAEA